MAVTFTISNLKHNVSGNRRTNTGKITFAGTTTDNGDTAPTAAQLGMHAIQQLKFDPNIDSTSNPENASGVKYIASTGKLVFFGGAAAGAEWAAVTDGTDVAGEAEFEAIGF